MITWTTVESSMIARIGYDGQSLFIKFAGKENTASGHTYEYLQVPELVYVDLLKARSFSGYYEENIRGKYRQRAMSVNPPSSTQYFTGKG